MRGPRPTGTDPYSVAARRLGIAKAELARRLRVGQVALNKRARRELTVEEQLALEALVARIERERQAPGGKMTEPPEGK